MVRFIKVNEYKFKNCCILEKKFVFGSCNKIKLKDKMCIFVLEWVVIVSN